MAELTWAVVPSNGRSYLDGCLRSLRDQVDGIVVVANDDFDPGDLGPDVVVVKDAGVDRNISRWWNLGLEAAEGLARARGRDPWNALVVNDDVVCPPHLVRTLADKLREYRAAIAYPNQRDDVEAVWTRAEPVNLFHRITGYCFMLAGESGLRLDEQFVWWAGDDDLFWRGNQAGGSVLVPGCRVEHLSPNGSFALYPELNAQAGRDMESFARKWGRRPW